MNKIYTAMIHKEDDLYAAECPKIGTVYQDSAKKNEI